jgi:hypothetical protein
LNVNSNAVLGDTQVLSLSGKFYSKSEQTVKTFLPVSATFTVGTPPVCSYAINPVSKVVGTIAGSGNVGLTAPVGCYWTASSTTPWLALSSGFNGTGNGIVNYSYTANTTFTSRTGTLSIADKTFTLTQKGEICAYSIMPSSITFSASGGTGSITLTAQTGCPWNASSNVPWITITSGGSASGSGAVSYAVSTNTFISQRTGTQRTGTVTVAGKTVTITQLSTESQRQPTPVTVSGRQVLVNGTPFTVRGVGYSPVPVGDDPEFGPLYGDYFTASHSDIYDRDLPLLRNMGANAVRHGTGGRRQTISTSSIRHTTTGLIPSM